MSATRGAEVTCSSGTYTPKLDDKGRLFLPAKFRDELAEGLVVTTRSGALPERVAHGRVRQLTDAAQEAPVTNKARPRLHPMLFAGASDEMPDKQGRVTIPPMLREYAALTKDVRRDRGDEPGRDLGPGQLAGVLRRRRSSVLRAVRGGLPGV